jgi:hypothetical protein
MAHKNSQHQCHHPHKHDRVWLIGIIAGIEYFSDKWPKAERMFSAVALIGFLLALSDEYVSYRYDEFKDPGVEVSEWFHAQDAKEEALIGMFGFPTLLG